MGATSMAKTMKPPAFPLLVAAALLPLGGCHEAPADGGVSVEHVWVRLPALPGGAAAGYFTATAPADDTLLGISAPGARIELHETMAMAGAGAMGAMTGMRPLANVPLAAGDEMR